MRARCTAVNAARSNAASPDDPTIETPTNAPRLLTVIRNFTTPLARVPDGYRLRRSMLLRMAPPHCDKAAGLVRGAGAAATRGAVFTVPAVVFCPLPEAVSRAREGAVGCFAGAAARRTGRTTGRGDCVGADEVGGGGAPVR